MQRGRSRILDGFLLVCFGLSLRRLFAFVEVKTRNGDISTVNPYQSCESWRQEE